MTEKTMSSSAVVMAANGENLPREQAMVRTSFSLGWRIAEARAILSPAADLRKWDEPYGPEEKRLVADRVQARLTAANSTVRAAGLRPPGYPTSWPAEDLPKDNGAASQQPEASQLHDVTQLHNQSQVELWAISRTLGIAYSLGHELACACSRKPAKAKPAFDSENRERWTDWLQQLATVMPEHAARAVALSLNSWKNKPATEANRGIVEQGERWRQCLTGEKAGQDMLQRKDYLAASHELIRIGVSELGRSHLVQGAIGITGALLFGAILVVVLVSSPAQLFGFLVPIAAAMGITGKTVAAALRRAADRIEAPIWGDILDRAIAIRLTAFTPSQQDVDEESKKLVERIPPEKSSG